MCTPFGSVMDMGGKCSESESDSPRKVNFLFPADLDLVLESTLDFAALDGGKPKTFTSLRYSI